MIDQAGPQIPDAEDIWQPAPERIALRQDEIHVWRASVRQSPAALQQFAATLSMDELVRAQRYRFAQDKDEFTAARGLLRAILARYTGRHPSHLHLRYGDWGKPELRETTGEEKLAFNVSHSGELVLIAVSLPRKIGIDLEWISRHASPEKIAERFFAPSEVLFLRALSEDRRRQAFFRLWTAKEAFLKAQGKGLSSNLASFIVKLESDNTAAITEIQDPREEGRRWFLRTLPMDEGYIATLAAENFQGQVLCWNWADRLGLEMPSFFAAGHAP